MTNAIQFTIRCDEGRRSDGSVGYTAWVKEMEGVTAEGDSPEEAVANLTEFLDSLADSRGIGPRVVINEPEFLEREGDDPWVRVESVIDEESRAVSGAPDRPLSYGWSEADTRRAVSVG